MRIVAKQFIYIRRKCIIKRYKNFIFQQYVFALSENTKEKVFLSFEGIPFEKRKTRI